MTGITTDGMCKLYIKEAGDLNTGQLIFQIYTELTRYSIDNSKLKLPAHQ